jgi:hypothetical protein
MSRSAEYSRFLGLNNFLDPARLRSDEKSGAVELAKAVNVDFDITGRVSRRRGYVLHNAADAHSLWSSGDYMFFVSGGSLYQLDAAGSAVGVRSGITQAARMSYTAYGEEVFYCNRYENGVIRDGRTSWSWYGQEYVGPETIWDISLSPPLGHLLATFGGYLLVASGNMLYWSMPFAPYHYRLSRDFFQFQSEVVMLAPVENGVFVSDQNTTWFLRGKNPSEWTRALRADYPAIAGTSVQTGKVRIGQDDLPDFDCTCWFSAKGICIGGGDGFFSNLTEYKLVVPQAIRGGGVFTNKRLIFTLEA